VQLALFLVAHLASLSMMRLDRRFLILMIPLLAIGAIYFFAALIPPRWERRRLVTSFNLMAMLAGLMWAVQAPVGFVQGRPSSDSTVIQVSNVLHAAGMSAPREVLSTHTRLQDAAALGRDRFAQAYWVAPGLQSVGDLVQVMRSRGWRFFIYDRDTGAQVYPALESLLSPGTRPAELAPVYYPNERGFVIYRLAESPDSCSTVGARLANGISLECYEAHVSQDAPAGSVRRLGVYLNWRTQSHLDASLKVFVHLLDAQGRLVAQDDSLPALWTYPTNDWQPGQVIVDFHQFPLDASLPSGEYTLQVGLYDEESGRRVSRVDASGNTVDDKILLSKLQLKP
jgi:hypothetical protein